VSCTVAIEAPARVHFGMLDLSGSLGRRFGGIGAGIHPPVLRLSASAARDLSVIAEGEAARSSAGLEEARAVVAQAAHSVLTHYRVAECVDVRLSAVLPVHRGLGSGTQLALATARAVARLFDLPDDAVGLSVIVGRAHRSAIGTYVFEHGGFIVEGGRRPDVDRPAPLVSRLPIPSDWRCVLALPPVEPGLSGSAEAAAFAALPIPPSHEAARVAHLVLMGLLPALADGDFNRFAAALAEIQDINGRWFSAAQHGVYASGASAALAETLKSWGASGVGQSSWGPAVYALAPDPDGSAALARRLSSHHPEIPVFQASFSAHGARTETMG
jgi:beta-ribofuranosylaminobenzene 5'-phosphate synthase